MLRRSLVLIDELGRATSTADGVGIAWAVSEYFIALGVFTLFATHFKKLGELPLLYPNAKLWHLQVAAQQARLEYTWRLQPGSDNNNHYGLVLARMIGFPARVMQQAEIIAEAIARDDDARCAEILPSGDAIAKAAVFELAHKVACAAQNWAFDSSVPVTRQLKRLRKEALSLSP